MAIMVFLFFRWLVGCSSTCKWRDKLNQEKQITCVICSIRFFQVFLFLFFLDSQVDDILKFKLFVLSIVLARNKILFSSFSTFFPLETFPKVFWKLFFFGTVFKTKPNQVEKTKVSRFFLNSVFCNYHHQQQQIKLTTTTENWSNHLVLPFHQVFFF